jgi:hypothetical protein
MGKSPSQDAVALSRPLLPDSGRPEGPAGHHLPSGRIAARAAVPFDGPLGALVRFSSDGILVVNREGRTLFANQTAVAALGHASIEALKSVPIEEALGPFFIEDPGVPAMDEGDVSGDVSSVFTRAIWFGSVAQVVRFRDPAAGWDRWVRVRSRPFVEQSGTHTAFLLMVQDVTSERRQLACAQFLDEATKRLAQSLSRQRILEHAAVVAVPRLADECVIIERSAASVWTPTAWYIPCGGAADRAAALVRSFGPLLVQVETGEHPLLIAPSREAVGLPLSGSMILVPIKRGTTVVGAMLLAMAADTARCHHPTDLALAEQFAERVAGCLANAQLYESEQRRRQANEDRLVSARRAAERRDALLVAVAYALSKQLSPLLSVADLLEGNDPHHLGEALRRQSLRLRSVVDTLLEASRISAADPEALRGQWEDQMRRLRALLGQEV